MSSGFGYIKPVVGTALPRQIAFVGPCDVGKTTAVRVVSQTGIATINVPLQGIGEEASRHLKDSSSNGLELGRWHTPDGTWVSVVSTPASARFDDVRRKALPRSAAVVLWLYGHEHWAPMDADLWLRLITREVPGSKLTVAVTRLEETDAAASLAGIREVVERYDSSIPVLAADPRDNHSVVEVLMTSLRGERTAEVIGLGRRLADARRRQMAG